MEIILSFILRQSRRQIQDKEYYIVLQEIRLGKFSSTTWNILYQKTNFPNHLHLQQGARVMYLKNNLMDKNIFNGLTQIIWPLQVLKGFFSSLDIILKVSDLNRLQSLS
ncbi:hypothetical protein C1645_738104 [Glomus cerebriforme]|uniref:DNA helicase n=1 Tax=Glomus cerebriforme TaxID=658196 RepID=A0A397SWS5_9GLOM|nr:hypothetical protein C1645_738104 [Glomus cerebriforme]